MGTTAQAAALFAIIDKKDLICQAAQCSLKPGPSLPQFPPEQPLSLKLRRTADAQNLLIKILHW